MCTFSSHFAWSSLIPARTKSATKLTLRRRGEYSYDEDADKYAASLNRHIDPSLAHEIARYDPGKEDDFAWKLPFWLVQERPTTCLRLLGSAPRGPFPIIEGDLRSQRWPLIEAHGSMYITSLRPKPSRPLLAKRCRIPNCRFPM